MYFKIEIEITFVYNTLKSQQRTINISYLKLLVINIKFLLYCIRYIKYPKTNKSRNLFDAAAVKSYNTVYELI